MKKVLMILASLLLILLTACGQQSGSIEPNVTAQGLTDHRLPWTSGETWKVTTGLHNNTQALDFDRDSTSRPILATKDGVIETVVTGRSNCTEANQGATYCQNLYGSDWYFGNYVTSTASR